MGGSEELQRSCGLMIENWGCASCGAIGLLFLVWSLSGKRFNPNPINSLVPK